MKIVASTPAYNERRYGRRWAAICSSGGHKVAMEFIDHAHIGGPGEAGRYEFEAPEGVIVALGQRDNCKGRSDHDYYRVTPGYPDGLERIASPTVEKIIGLIRAQAGPDHDQLRAERARLMRRVEEIDRILGA